MRNTVSKCLKLCMYVTFMGILTFLLAHFTKIEENAGPDSNQMSLAENEGNSQEVKELSETLSVFDKPVSGKCLKRGDIDFIVTYTLWGNAMMPLFTITCSSKKDPGQKFQIIPESFFRRHNDEKPTLKFPSAKKDGYYTLVLAHALGLETEQRKDHEDPIRWIVSNLPGKILAVGIHNWKTRNMGSEILEYKAPSLRSSDQLLYQFILFKQEEIVDIDASGLIKTQLERLIQTNILSQVASASFVTGSDDQPDD